jgi:hypothetical protein
MQSESETKGKRHTVSLDSIEVRTCPAGIVPVLRNPEVDRSKGRAIPEGSWPNSRIGPDKRRHVEGSGQPGPEWNGTSRDLSQRGRPETESAEPSAFLGSNCRQRLSRRVVHNRIVGRAVGTSAHVAAEMSRVHWIDSRAAGIIASSPELAALSRHSSGVKRLNWSVLPESLRNLEIRNPGLQ